jgi:hypothetical protein
MEYFVYYDTIFEQPQIFYATQIGIFCNDMMCRHGECLVTQVAIQN